jgi:hypothetical protein
MSRIRRSNENQGFGYNAEEHGLDPVEKVYRDALGDGIEAVLGDGAEELSDVAKGLNERHVTGPSGESWTEELLAAELNRLAR